MHVCKLYILYVCLNLPFESLFSPILLLYHYILNIKLIFNFMTYYQIWLKVKDNFRIMKSENNNNNASFADTYCFPFKYLYVHKVYKN